MNLIDKQLNYRKPDEVKAGINEGMRALSERYEGSIESAIDHCVNHVSGLTDHKLERIKSNTPRYNRDGGSS